MAGIFVLVVDWKSRFESGAEETEENQQTEYLNGRLVLIALMRGASVSGFTSWKSYLNFEQVVRYQRRYARTREIDDFLEKVLVSAQDKCITLTKGSKFWRAQLGNDWRKEHDGEQEFDVQCAHSPERMKPLKKRAQEGRVNPKGIPCLYLSTKKETAMLEVRPWIGSLVSVGQFQLFKAISIVNCWRGYNHAPIYLKEPSQEEIDKATWAYIDGAFAKPVVRGGDTAEYAPTQIIAESFKEAGFGGIGYKSNFGENGYNIALFDPDVADLINCGLYEVGGIEMEFSQMDNPYFVSKYRDQNE